MPGLSTTHLLPSWICGVLVPTMKLLIPWSRPLAPEPEPAFSHRGTTPGTLALIFSAAVKMSFQLCAVHGTGSPACLNIVLL
jgi:hypothetical protein